MCESLENIFLLKLRNLAVRNWSSVENIQRSIQRVVYTVGTDVRIFLVICEEVNNVSVTPC
jgi:hypothetical protein